MSSASRSLARHRAAARTIAMLRLLARRVTSTPLASTSRISRLVPQQPCARAGASSAARPLARNAAAVARATSTIQQRASTTTTATNNHHHHVNKCASSLTYDRASPYERTHLCGQVGREQHQRRVRLWGWVRSVRPSGKHLVFVTLRDYSGVVQLVVSDAALVDAAAELRSESVVWVEGVVQHRPTGALNEQLSTGAVEVRVSLLRLLSSVPSLPSEYTSLLQKDKTDAASLARPSTDAADATDAAADERLAVSVSDEARLRYRVLDLRRPHMQRNLRLRSRAAAAIRRIYDGTNSRTHNHHVGHVVCSRYVPRWRRGGLHRGRDADAVPHDARGRARVPGAEHTREGQGLRVAPEPTAVQAASHGWRHRSILSSGSLLSRRGAAS